MEANQIWLWYVDEELVDVFIIKEVVNGPHDEPVAHLYGEGTQFADSITVKVPGKFRKQFFDDMELLEDIDDMVEPTEKALVQSLCEKFAIPVPKKK